MIRSHVAKWFVNWLYHSKNFRGKMRVARFASRFLDGAPVQTINGPKIGARLSDNSSWIAVCEVNDRFLTFSLSIGPDDLFIDVGANIGLMSLIVAHRAKTCIAIEPSPLELIELYKNIALNQVHNIWPLQIAAGETFSLLNLTRFEHSGLNSVNVGPHSIAGMNILGLPLDSIVSLTKAASTYRRIFLKIDVEGYELNVLKGLVGTLREATVSDVFVELGSTRTQYSSEDRGLNGHDQIYQLMRDVDFIPLYPRDEYAVYDQHFVKNLSRTDPI